MNICIFLLITYTDRGIFFIKKKWHTSYFLIFEYSKGETHDVKRANK